MSMIFKSYGGERVYLRVPASAPSSHVVSKVKPQQRVESIIRIIQPEIDLRNQTYIFRLSGLTQNSSICKELYTKSFFLGVKVQENK